MPVGLITAKGIITLLYVESLTKSTLIKVKIVLPHFSWVILELLFYLWFSTYVSHNFLDINLINSPLDIQHYLVLPQFLSGLVFFQLVRMFYLYKTYMVYLDYEKRMHQRYSSLENIELKWIRELFVAIIIGIILFVLAEMYQGFTGKKSMLYIYFIYLNLFVFWVSIKSFLQSEVPVSGKQAMKPEELKADEAESELNKLIYIIKQKEIFKQTDLRLDELATAVKMDSKTVSKLINQSAQTNFHDFVNGIRVEYLKNTLKDPAKRDFKIERLAYEAGFKAKSTYFPVFKRFTGLTPNQYKKKYQN